MPVKPADNILPYQSLSQTVRHRTLSNNLSRLVYSVYHFEHITTPNNEFYDCVKCPLVPVPLTTL